MVETIKYQDWGQKYPLFKIDFCDNINVFNDTNNPVHLYRLNSWKVVWLFVCITFIISTCFQPLQQLQQGFDVPVQLCTLEERH